MGADDFHVSHELAQKDKKVMGKNRDKPMDSLRNLHGIHFCPVCKKPLWQADDSNYCFRCGQRVRLIEEVKNG